jgi:hypothetical protein
MDIIPFKINALRYKFRVVQQSFLEWEQMDGLPQGRLRHVDYPFRMMKEARACACLIATLIVKGRCKETVDEMQRKLL